MTTFAPYSANPRAIESPMPLLAPVTIATLPANSKRFLVLSFISYIGIAPPFACKVIPDINPASFEAKNKYV